MVELGFLRSYGTEWGVAEVRVTGAGNEGKLLGRLDAFQEGTASNIEYAQLRVPTALDAHTLTLGLVHGKRFKLTSLRAC